jgi:hypothetical protein
VKALIIPAVGIAGSFAVILGAGPSHPAVAAGAAVAGIIAVTGFPVTWRRVFRGRS